MPYLLNFIAAKLRGSSGVVTIRSVVAMAGYRKAAASLL